MAATRLIALHRNKGKTLLRSLTDRADYVKNPEKTEKGDLVTGYQCDPYTCAEEFLLTKQAYALTTGLSQENDVIAYQIRQSFKPGEVAPEEANEIGRETTLRFTNGKHAFIVATHTDRAHIHNHIIFNSTELSGTRKFRDFRRSGLALQKVSDLVCLEHGLSVITPGPYGERTRRTEWPKRDVSLLVDVQRKLQVKGKGYEIWATRFNLKQMAKSLLFLRDHGIKNLQELDALAERLTDRKEELLKGVRSREERLSGLQEMKNHILDYMKTKEIFRAYRESGYADQYHEEHRDEIAKYKAAKKAFDSLEGKPIPKLKDINGEFQRVLQKKREAYKEFQEASRNAREALIVRENIRSLYRAEESEREKDREKERSK